jgi:hypothetical protein
MKRVVLVSRWFAAILIVSLLLIVHPKEIFAGTQLYNGSTMSAGGINAGETRAQQFNAADFNTLRVSCPNWASNNSSLTLTLYTWNTDYATTITGIPIATKTFVNFADNSWLEMSFPEQASDHYLWVLSDPSGTPGVWALLDSTDPSVAYHNGNPQDYDYKSEIYLAAPPLTPDIIAPFLGQLNTSATVGQQYEYWASTTRADSTDTNKFMFLFDWGDGTQSLSGQGFPNGRGFHSWNSPGTYAIKAKAFDHNGTPSANWSPTVNVTVSGNAASPSILVPVSVTASSEYSSLVIASKAADGDSTTFWSSSANANIDDAPQWLKFDLGSIKTVDAIKVTPRQDGLGFPAALKVQYSNDNTTWFDLPVLNAPYYPNPGSTPQMLETNKIQARYMRLYSDQLGFDGYAYYFQLADVQIYGDTIGNFQTSMGDLFDANLNNMWTVFGTAKNETIPHGSNWFNSDGGGVMAYGSTEWHYWNAIKLAWTGEAEAKNVLKNTIYNAPIDPDGYIWAHAYGRLHLDAQKHDTYNATYVLGAYEYYRWTKDISFLTDTLPAYTNSSAPVLPLDVVTLMDKLRKAMDWMLTTYNGSSGLFIYTEPGYDGTPSTGPSSANYWDAIPFGYKDAYANALMYQAIKGMAELEDATGNTANANTYRNLLPLVKSAFNDTFWDSAKGRYIATVDVHGVKHDYGFTFLNTMAVNYGLASTDQARQIYDWLDGKRIISGDTSTGSDIYTYKISARSNTLDMASSLPYWWDGTFGTDPGPSGCCSYGNNIQNGGTILYTSYDDIMGRIASMGADNAFDRFQTILDEFQKDELRRTLSESLNYVAGTINDFPESGLVPTVMIHGFLGLSANNDGLHIAPKIPTSLMSIGVNEISYNGSKYKITANKSITTATITNVGTDSYEVVVPNGQEVVVSGGSIVSTIAGYPSVWASASTTYSDALHAGQVIDKDSDTCWSSTLQNKRKSTQWVAVDRGAQYSLGTIKLMPCSSGQGFPVDFKLQYNTNGTDWTDIPGQSYEKYANPGNMEQTFTLSLPVNARYFRVYATKIVKENKNNYVMRLAEIQLE